MRKTADNTWPEELPFLELDRLTWLRPNTDTDLLAGPRRVEALDALTELFALVTPYQDWLDALEAKQRLIQLAGPEMRRVRALQIAREPGMRTGWAAVSREARSLARQETRRRQKFDLALKAWANTYGLLGVGNAGQGDYVPDIFRAVVALRAWALPDAGADRGHRARVLYPRFKGYPSERSVPGEALRMRHEELRINAQAGLCTRSMDGQWHAPTLWAAVCHVVRDAEALGIRFALCSAEDCYNPFVASHGKREHCSKRCANRARVQRLQLEKTLRE